MNLHWKQRNLFFLLLKTEFISEIAGIGSKSWREENKKYVYYNSEENR